MAIRQTGLLKTPPVSPDEYFDAKRRTKYYGQADRNEGFFKIGFDEYSALRRDALKYRRAYRTKIKRREAVYEKNPKLREQLRERVQKARAVRRGKMNNGLSD